MRGPGRAWPKDGVERPGPPLLVTAPFSPQGRAPEPIFVSWPSASAGLTVQELSSGSATSPGWNLTTACPWAYRRATGGFPRALSQLRFVLDAVIVSSVAFKASEFGRN